MTANRIDFVDKDDAGSILLALLKQVADPASAHAYKHLDKVGTRDAEERHVGFTSHGPGQQGLARTWMAHQQNAFGNASTQLLELLRFAQELDDLPQLFLSFVDAGHILDCAFFLRAGDSRP